MANGIVEVSLDLAHVHPSAATGAAAGAAANVILQAAAIILPRNLNQANNRKDQLKLHDAGHVFLDVGIWYTRLQGA